MRMQLIFPETRVIGLHCCRCMSARLLFKFVQWAPNDASFLWQSAFWPFKAIQGRWLWYTKRVCDFLLVGHWDYGPILYRFWDTATYLLKIAYFPPIPLSHAFGAMLPICSLWNFALTRGNYKSWTVLQWRPHDRSMCNIDTVPACPACDTRTVAGLSIYSIQALCRTVRTISIL